MKVNAATGGLQLYLHHSSRNQKIKKSIMVFALVFIILSISSIQAAVGWYDPQLLETSIHEYRVTVDRSGIMYVVYTRRIETPGNASQSFSIVLDEIGQVKKTLKLYDMRIPVTGVIFSMSPVVAVSAKYIMVFWQEPSLIGRGMKIKYILINKNSFAIEKNDELRMQNSEVFQPEVFVDDNQNFHLFLQVKAPQGKISLAHYLYKNDSFNDMNYIISNIESVGRGAFFPSILFKDGIIHIVYQSKQNDTLTDELFYIKSTNLGSTFSTPERITKNSNNDFSPSLYANPQKKAELVWQSNEKENWQIYYSPDLKKQQKVSNSLSNTYQPSIAYSSNTGRVIAWLDERVNPSQIFSKFIDLNEDDTPFAREHQVTGLAGGAVGPLLLNLGDNIFLFFVNNNNLYRIRADRETSPIEIYSSTHPQNTVSVQTDVILNWRIFSEPSGINGYAYLLDSRPDSAPDFYNLNGNANSITKKGLPGGNYYFHLRYKDKAGNESPVYTYAFSIDTANPVLAEIKSSTHAENIPEKKNEFKVTYSGLDDIGLKGYYYTLSANRGAKLANFTESTSLVFPDLNEGEYYFLVQAVDKTGKTSPVVSYKINVIPGDYDDFHIETSIQNGQIQSDFTDISIQINNPEKKLLFAFASLSAYPEDPVVHGKKIDLVKADGLYKAKIPMPLYKWGLYTLSIRLEYQDHSKSSIRNFHLEYRNPGIEETKTQYVARGQEIITRQYDNSTGLIEEIQPDIELHVDRGLYRVSFSLPERYKPLLSGYSYQISATPQLPEGELNYIEEPVCIYDLAAGIYYISVKPVFKNEHANRKSNYSYLRFVVKGDTLLQNNILYFLLAGFALVIMVLYRKKIIFYLGKYR
ncbi:MAG: hypothetical protein OEV66_10915 [Spirochaetia bacterium]|nr:hypothetical protein [Spirochaetia bacterium]